VTEVPNAIAKARHIVMEKSRQLGDWSRGLDLPSTYEPPLPNAEMICTGLVKDGYLERKRVPHEEDTVFVYKPVYAHEVAK